MRHPLVLFALAALAVHCGSPSSDAPVPSGATTTAGVDPPGSRAPSDADEDASTPAPVDAGAEASAVAPFPKPTPSGPFVVGLNEAWFGPSYASDLTTSFDLAEVDAAFDGIRAAGARVVRVWLFEAMEGIPLGATSPRIGDVSPTLLANLELVLQAARARGLAVYLTGLDGNAMPADAGPTRDLYYNLLNGLYGETDAYEAKVLAPTLARLAPYADVLYAFDVVNEIEAPRHRSYWSDPIGGPRGYLKRTVAFVKAHAPGLPVTASAGSDTAAYDLGFGLFSGLGFDFYDLHVYADDGAIPNLASVCAKAQADGIPVILGELGQLAHTEDDMLQVAVTKAFVGAAKGSCFRAALPWRWDAAESYWRFLRPDGSPRPVVAALKALAP